MTHGSFVHALKLLGRSIGGKLFNMSFIECLNGTMRERLATITRKYRHASSKLHAFRLRMYIIGCTSNLCFLHHALSQTVEKIGFGGSYTPAMTSGLIDHPWNVLELVTYKVTSPPRPFPSNEVAIAKWLCAHPPVSADHYGCQL